MRQTLITLSTFQMPVGAVTSPRSSAYSIVGQTINFVFVFSMRRLGTMFKAKWPFPVAFARGRSSGQKVIFLAGVKESYSHTTFYVYSGASSAWSRVVKFSAGMSLRAAWVKQHD